MPAPASPAAKKTPSWPGMRAPASSPSSAGTTGMRPRFHFACSNSKRANRVDARSPRDASSTPAVCERRDSHCRSVDSRGRHLHVPEKTQPDSRPRSEEHTSELQSPDHLVCRLLLEKKKKKKRKRTMCECTKLA